MMPEPQMYDERLGLFQHRAWDFWFAPKRFESPQLYERLGVLWIKRYVPTGGDYFRKKYGVRVIDIKSTIESLLAFEKRTRFYEAIHLGAFLAFLLFSIWQLVCVWTNQWDWFCHGLCGVCAAHSFTSAAATL